jgi:hypothetical protein
MRRPRVRLGMVLLLMAITVASTACQITLGCTTYSWGFPHGLHVDDSACVSEPPVVIPEAPFALLLPAVAVAAGALVIGRRSRLRRLGQSPSA